MEALLLSDFASFKLPVDLSNVGDPFLPDRLNLALLFFCQFEPRLHAGRKQDGRTEKAGLNSRKLRALQGVQHRKGAPVKPFIELKKPGASSRTLLPSRRHRIRQLPRR